MNEELVMDLRKVVASFSKEAAFHTIFKAISDDIITKYGIFNVIFTFSQMIRTQQIRIKTEFVEKRHRRR